MARTKREIEAENAELRDLVSELYDRAAEFLSPEEEDDEEDEDDEDDED